MPTLPKGALLLVIGSGPIVIGQAAEFDYAGTQACKALREEGYGVVLVNSNPATIMTDQGVADKVYIEPLNVATLTEIIRMERPAGLLATLGGQTALNLAVELAEAGVLETYGVQLLGTPLSSIQRAEDRQLFKDLMEELHQPIPESAIVHTMAEGVAFVEEIGLPVIIRPAYTLGGTGGGIASTMEEMQSILTRGLKQSPIGQVLIERSIRGWKEIEYEVMRDANDTCITICNMENFDPVGVHTGDSIVVAPSQTLTDREYQMLRTAAVRIIRALKIEGGCNVQFALDPHSMNYCVIEVNPRVSRSSALASKATGYPIAKIAAKIAVGLHLDEIVNPVTGKTFAAFEPALDYIVVKVPRWPFDKFPQANRALGTQMKATGEVMALGRSFEEGLQKALRSLEIGVDGLYLAEVNSWNEEQVTTYLCGDPDDRRIFVLAEAFRRGYALTDLHAWTQVDEWFLYKLQDLVAEEKALEALVQEKTLVSSVSSQTTSAEQSAPAGGSSALISSDHLAHLKRLGFADTRIAALLGTDADTIRALRHAHGIRPAYTLVDTCAAEFESTTPYFFSTYHGAGELVPSEGRQKALVLGSGPIRIGQGIEFDYCSVHAVWALERLGYETVILNNNPETVSTDFDTADRLYFEPLTVEDVLEVVDLEGIDQTFVQFGGQTAINLAEKLQQRGVKIAGTTTNSIDMAEDRERFRTFLQDLNIPQSEGGTALETAGALTVANSIGYPVVVRPSYVIGGRAMAVVYSDSELAHYMEHAADVSRGPILIDQYLAGREVEVDAVCDGEHVLIPGIFEHIERAGVHSGDSMAVYPPQGLTQQEIDTLVVYTEQIAKQLPVVGLINIQFVIVSGEIFVLEVNPRASRTVPIISKVTGVPLVDLAVRVQCGHKLTDCGYGTGLFPAKDYVVVKAPVFSFGKITGLDIPLGPEMKSTGEVLGVGATFAEALAKAFVGAGIALPDVQAASKNAIFLSICDRLKPESLPLLARFAALGLAFHATPSTADWLEKNGVPCTAVARDAEAVQDLLKSGTIQLVLNLPTLAHDPSRLGYNLRRFTVEMRIPCLTSLDTAAAWLASLESGSTDKPHLMHA
ncbi:carbamoyl-phosphate synthase large subunit [Tumebacillus permanentifrigoris]|uniref:Carbamoyl phosphate synthase large chain n=1 Tax=Tumebacillus permanentifrigoris TaxID=378543 RepID=A0A316D3S2_9BACL|nr:carbamoyl-phosphate synthase large subunit [Tumebacillus permanentifrigoris]PWK04977.1 carbamoyl-phosphate synthase large subunit [Tumebacillus permanentifrigoris]